MVYVCHTGLLTACGLSANLYILLCVQWKTPDDGQRTCPKHVEFYSKNKCEKLVHLVGYLITIYHDAQSSERQTVLPIKILFYMKYESVIFFSGRSVWHDFSMAEFDDVICGYKLRQSRIQFWLYRNSCLQCCHSDWICYMKLIPMNISFQRFHFSNLHLHYHHPGPLSRYLGTLTSWNPLGTSGL